jgi:hypothetical protein
VIRVHIERVVVHDIDIAVSSTPAFRRAVARAVEAELRTTGSVHGLAPQALAFAAGPRMQLPPAPTATTTGSALGRSLAALVARPDAEVAR